MQRVVGSRLYVMSEYVLSGILEYQSSIQGYGYKTVFCVEIYTTLLYSTVFRGANLRQWIFF